MEQAQLDGPNLTCTRAAGRAEHSKRLKYNKHSISIKELSFEMSDIGGNIGNIAGNAKSLFLLFYSPFFFFALLYLIALIQARQKMFSVLEMFLVKAFRSSGKPI